MGGTTIVSQAVGVEQGVGRVLGSRSGEMATLIARDVVASVDVGPEAAITALNTLQDRVAKCSRTTYSVTDAAAYAGAIARERRVGHRQRATVTDAATDEAGTIVREGGVGYRQRATVDVRDATTHGVGSKLQIPS